MKKKVLLRIAIVMLISLILVAILGINYINRGAVTTQSIGTNVEASFNSATGALTIYSTSGVGTIYNGNIRNLYQTLGYDNIKSITFTNTVYAPSDSSYLFAWTKVSTINNLTYLNTSKVTNMEHMFYVCDKLVSLDLSNFNTSNVTNMNGMFSYCSSLTSLNVSSFNTSSVTKMESMFEICSSLTSLNVSSFNTSSVTSMSGMFSNCSSLTSLNVSSFNTSSVTDTSGMFIGCSSLTSLNVSSFNTSSVTRMDAMFMDCSSLTSLNVSSFNTSKVTEMCFMFTRCSSLISLNVSNFNTSNVTDMQAMFDGCSSLISLDLSNFNTSKVTNMKFMFSRCSSLKILDLSSFDMSKAEVTSQLYPTEAMLQSCYSLLEIYTPYRYSLGSITLPGNYKNVTNTNDTNIYTSWTNSSFNGSVKLARYYNVTLNTNSGTINSGNITGYAYGVGETLPTNVTRSGYTFGGWYENSSLTGTRAYVVGNSTTGDKTYYAKWTAATYTVTLNNQSATSAGTTSVNATYGSAMPSITVPSKTGYTFGGYYTSTNGGGTQYYTAAGASARAWDKTSATTLYAKWTANTNTAYKVEHYQMNLNGTSYSLKDTENKTGTTGANATATAKTYTGFTENTSHSSRKASGTIEGDGSLVLKLYYNRNQRTFTLGTCEGVNTTGSSASGTYYYGATITLKASVSTGYTWSKWSNNDTNQNTTVIMPDNNLTISPIAVKNAYTVTFDPNGGQVSPTSKQVSFGNPYGDLPTPTKSGFGFDGWYNSAGTKIEVTTIVNITSDETLIARWSGGTYTITFNTNGGTINSGNVTQYTYGNGVLLPSDVTKTGYTFDGWYDNSSLTGSIQYSIGNSDSGNKVYYAKWTPKKYTVALNNQGATTAGTTSVSATYESPMPKITVPTKTGYTFEGYYTEMNGGGTQYYTATGESARAWDKASAAMLYAKWEGVTTYTVTLNNQGATTAGTTSVDAIYGSAMPSITVPTKTGYTFGGYYTQINGEGTQYYTEAGESAREWDKLSATTLYARWLAAANTAYKVEHYQMNLNGIDYALVETENLTGTTGTNVTAVSKPYTGFTENTTHSDRKPSGMILSDGSLILKLYYNRNQRTFTLGTCEGVNTTGSTASGTYYYGATIYLKASVSTGYTWSKWSNNDANQNTTVTMPDNDLTISPIAVKNVYTVTFNPDGGQVSPTSKQVSYGNPYGDLPTPTKQGFGFDGWYNSAGTKIEVTTIVNITSDETLVARWSGGIFTITFNPNGGQVNPTSKQVTYGQLYGNLPTPTKPGYVFTGWYDPNGNQITKDDIVNLTGDITLTPRWEGEEYTIIFEPGDNATVNPTTKVVKNGEPYGDLPVPTRPGYDFDGWTDESGNDITPTTIVNLTDDSPIVAKWKGKNYIVTFNPNGGQVSPTSKQVTNGQAYGSMPIPTREGYSFDGWYNASGNIVNQTDIVNTTGDIELIAGWKEEGFTLTFDANGGQVNPTTKIVYHLKPYGNMPTPIRNGYEFDGWYTELTGGNKIEAVTVYNLESNSTVYAHWTYNPLYLRSILYKIGENNIDEYQTNDKYIDKIEPNTTVGMFKRNCNTNGTIVVIDNEENGLSNIKLVGTGMLVRDMMDDRKIEVKAIVMGDLDGNGKITVTDLSVLNRTLIGKITLDEMHFKAADLDHNNRISPTDLSMMNRFLVGRLIFKYVKP